MSWFGRDGWFPSVRNPPAPEPAVDQLRGHVPPRPIPAPAPRALYANENADPTYPKPPAASPWRQGVAVGERWVETPAPPPPLKPTATAPKVDAAFSVGLGRLEGGMVVVLSVNGERCALDRAAAEAAAEMLRIAALEVDAGAQNGIDGSSGSGGLRSDSGISTRQAEPSPSPLGANSMDAMDAATGSPHNAVRAAEMASSISTAE